MAGHEPSKREVDSGARILAELRDLRAGTRADRQRSDEERRTSERERLEAQAQWHRERQQADEAWRAERRQVDDERRQADEAWRQERRLADEERRLADAAWREERRLAELAWRAEREETNARFAGMLREFREDSIQRAAATERAWRDVRDVGLSIVKPLNLHTRILQRIDRKLDAGDDGRSGPNGGGAPPGR